MTTRRPRRALTFDEVLERIRREYHALPGLQLTKEQACRLWGLSDAECWALMARLVDTRFLARTEEGAFVRADMRPQIARPRSPVLPPLRTSAPRRSA